MLQFKTVRLLQLVQVIADKVAQALDSEPSSQALRCRERWARQPWFARLLSSRWNSGIKEKIDKGQFDKVARDTDLDMLVLFLR
jgi:hypothetical protein